MAVTTTADVAAEVRAALARHGGTQRWLAEVTGIDAPGLSRRLRGHRPFTLAELLAVADALDVPVSAFFPPQAGAA